MNTPFIRNHQFNVIKKQADFLQNTLRTVADRRVLETVRYTAADTVVNAFTELTADQRELLEQISAFESGYDFQRFLDSMEPLMVPYPDVTLKQIQKLFPKTKKLKVPDLSTIDFRYITYLSWVDIAANKLFIVYPYEGQFIGIEGRLLPVNKKGYCLFCNRHQELAFLSVSTKPVHASQDNIASVGQYVCMDNLACNHSITSTEALERFVRSVRKP